MILKASSNIQPRKPRLWRHSQPPTVYFEGLLLQFSGFERRIYSTGYILELFTS